MVFGGTGKTELVNVVVREKAVVRFFDGGVLIAHAGPSFRAPDCHLKQWLTLMGHTVLTEWPVEHLRHLIRSELHDRKVLVIIDGAQRAADVAPYRLPGVWARYMVISNQRDLRFKLERRTCEAITVDPLGLEAGRRLFRRLLANMPETANLPSGRIDEVADRCGGLPLALELAAKAIARVGWDRLRVSMAAPQARLTALTLPRPEELHHSLLFTLLNGYYALPTRLQSRLLALGRIGSPVAHASPGISPGPAGHIWKTDPTAAEEALEELADASWLHIEANGDYAFRPFVAELLAVLGDHKSREKVLQRYLAVTEHRC